VAEGRAPCFFPQHSEVKNKQTCAQAWLWPCEEGGKGLMPSSVLWNWREESERWRTAMSFPVSVDCSSAEGKHMLHPAEEDSRDSTGSGRRPC